MNTGKEGRGEFRMRNWLVGVGMVLACSVGHAGDWVDDWFDQSTSSGPGSYQSQQRGFYSAGQFTARRRMTNDYLVTASPPRIEIGCGGIDLFGGAFSYLDAEYLVEKFERVLQAAPALAFQIAMQEYCKPCVAGMEALENITNQLNQMQLNDCAMARGLATTIVKPHEVGDQLRGLVAQGTSFANDLRKNVQDFSESVSANNGNPPDPTEEAIADCPTTFRDVFGSGSVLENITNLVGMGDYADAMRGLVGDAVVTYNTSINQFEVETFSYCLGNDEMDASDFIEGRIEEMDAGGTCSTVTFSPIETIVTSTMTSIAGKLAPGSTAPLTADEIAFINAAPYPLLNILRDGAASQTAASKIEMMARPLTAAYAQRVFDDLLKALRFAAAKTNQVAENASSSVGNPERCKPQVVQQAVTHFEGMVPKLSNYRDRAQRHYMTQISELNAAVDFARSQLEERRRFLNRTVVGEQ